MKNIFNILRSSFAVVRYIICGRRPWSPGYIQYKDRLLSYVLKKKELLDCFLYRRRLPFKYGYRLDERVIEYPWLFSRFGKEKERVLDAGSVLNQKYILDSAELKNKSTVIYNLSLERVFERKNVSYIYGDLRHTGFENDLFDVIVCLSTLEHIGMNNTFLYSKEDRFNESRTGDHKIVVGEFKRLLKPGGRLFISFPYGRYENHGWLQQFDKEMVKEVISIFGGSSSNVSYYRYFSAGWQISDADSCADCSYFDIHNFSGYAFDYAAAARAVACIEMVK